MIFYFSGTGNSLYAAKYLSANIGDAEIIDIAQAVREQKYSYFLRPEEACGFVFPVYFGGMPSIVAQFVKKLQLSCDAFPYVYALVTYGGKAGGSLQALQVALEKRNIGLCATFGVKMPDNYVIMYNPSSEKEAEKTLQAAQEPLRTAVKEILSRSNPGVGHTPADTVMTAGMQIAYKMMRKTASFKAENKCIACGLCESVCPIGAIELRDYKPVWVTNECVHCVACISRCPVQAIQYGEKTKKRTRYVHPDLKTKAE